MGSPWFVRPDPRPGARLRLFCFPHAGGGASAYRPWAAVLPPEIEPCLVQAPGREMRLRETPIKDLDELVDALGEQMDPWLDRPFAFFGHSMGACVAFELARRLKRTGRPSPVRLFASGRRAPRLPDRDGPMHVLPDAAFVAEIRRRYAGIPDEVMRHPDLLALLLPGLRADIAAIERYRYRADEPLRCPIMALGGTQDQRAPAHELDAWRMETTGPFALRLFPGGHFFLQTARPAVIGAVLGALRGDLFARDLQRTGT